MSFVLVSLSPIGNMMEVAKVHGIFFREIMPVSTGVVIGGP